MIANKLEKFGFVLTTVTLGSIVVLGKVQCS